MEILDVELNSFPFVYLCFECYLEKNAAFVNYLKGNFTKDSHNHRSKESLQQAFTWVSNISLKVSNPFTEQQMLGLGQLLG